MLIKERIVLINDFLVLFLKTNKGIALGMLADLPEIYSTYLRLFIASILGLMTLYMLFCSRRMGFFSRTGLLLMLAGGISNQIDRLWSEGVIDMLEVSLFGMKLFTCNLADIYISLGFMLYLLSGISFGRSKQFDAKNEKKNLPEKPRPLITKPEQKTNQEQEAIETKLPSSSNTASNRQADPDEDDLDINPSDIE